MSRGSSEDHWIPDRIESSCNGEGALDESLLYSLHADVAHLDSVRSSTVMSRTTPSMWLNKNWSGVCACVLHDEVHADGLLARYVRQVRRLEL